ncbi:MAG: hypothetical protein QM526_01460 [Alphaproteobacteria bacterium]|nr:hypothetical protein [Alphaproteobacteria bacterium]
MRHISIFFTLCILLGGLNVGIIGVTSIVGPQRFDVIQYISVMVLQTPIVASIVYIIIGVSAVSLLFFSSFFKCLVCICDDTDFSVPSTTHVHDTHTMKHRHIKNKKSQSQQTESAPTEQTTNTNETVSSSIEVENQ